MKISVVIATIGRPELVPVMLGALGRQTRAPDLVVISAVKEGDVKLVDTPFETAVLFGPKGLTRQRNRALDLAESRSDIIIFFDDDFIPADDWIEEVEAIFEDAA